MPNTYKISIWISRFLGFQSWISTQVYEISNGVGPLGSKIQGSAVEAFIQLTVFNLCHDKDKIKWEPIAGYQYTVRVKVL